MEVLQRSNNSKVQFKKNHLNTFGLYYGDPSRGGTCPCATKGTGGCLSIRDKHQRPTCYVSKITEIYKATGNVLIKNTELLKDKTEAEMSEILRNTVAEFVNKTDSDKLFFRIHWSGDFFNKAYASAWATVMQEFPNVRFWAYTRSFRDSILNVVPELVKVQNLTLYLSIDPDNKEDGLKVYSQLTNNHPNLGLSWLGENPPEDHRWVKCPDITGKLKDPKDGSGPCSRCRLCVDRYVNKVKNIQFPIH